MDNTYAIHRPPMDTWLHNVSNSYFYEQLNAKRVVSYTDHTDFIVARDFGSLFDQNPYSQYSNTYTQKATWLGPAPRPQHHQHQQYRPSPLEQHASHICS